MMLAFVIMLSGCVVLVAIGAIAFAAGVHPVALHVEDATVDAMRDNRISKAEFDRICDRLYGQERKQA